jgi:hypothetical protein
MSGSDKSSLLQLQAPCAACQMAAKSKQSDKRVWLGLAGDMVEPGEALTHHATKCGGAPRYPGRRPPLAAADLACRVCGKPLSLTLQVCVR